MRRTPIAALALAFALASGGADAQTLKIAYINSQQILATAPGAQEANEAFQQEVATYEAEAQELQDELEGMQRQLEQQQLTLSPEARRNREQAIRQKAQEAQQRMAQLDQQAAQKRQELIQPIMDRITQVIEKIRDEGNYALILDVAAGSILAADPTLDLTDEVIRRLQQAASTGAPGS